MYRFGVLHPYFLSKPSVNLWLVGKSWRYDNRLCYACTTKTRYSLMTLVSFGASAEGLTFLIRYVCFATSLWWPMAATVCTHGSCYYFCLFVLLPLRILF